MRRGTAAAEFALVLPLLIVLGLGIAEFGQFVTHLHHLQRAARDGARVGQLTLEGVDPDGTSIEAAAIAQAMDVLDANGVDCSGGGCTVTADWTTLFENDDTHWVVITVQAPYQASTRFIPELATPRARFAMLTQQQPPDE